MSYVEFRTTEKSRRLGMVIMRLHGHDCEIRYCEYSHANRSRIYCKDREMLSDVKLVLAYSGVTIKKEVIE